MVLFVDRKCVFFSKTKKKPKEEHKSQGYGERMSSSVFREIIRKKYVRKNVT